MTVPDHVTLREQVSRVLAAHGDRFVAGYLFGSQSKRTATPESDVDVAVWFRALPAEPYARMGLDLAAELEDALSREVDVVVLDDAPVDLVKEAIAGELVYEGDRSARVAREVRARSEYFDLQPFLRRYRRVGIGGA
jgi:predicted nucleotidyltransferase